MSKSSNIDKTLGENIRKLRILKGLSQTVVAEALDPPITFQQLQKYESGKNRMSAVTLLTMVDILGCRLDDILAGAKNFKENQQLPDYDLKFLAAYHSIKDIKFKQHIKNLVMEMAK